MGWNLERHSAWPTAGVPTYHVDEYFLVEGMRQDFRLFSAYPLLVDGPLSANLMYLPLAIMGERPPDRFSARDALLAGRIASAVADCLAFPVLWLLLTALGASPWATLFGLAAITFAPNQVFNAHFARSHVIANLLQLVVILATAKSLIATARIQRALWFGAAVLFSLLAGSARYPMLTLGVLPGAAGVWILLRADPRSERGAESRALAVSGLIALVLGLLVGFRFHPFQILRDAFAFQAGVGQLQWDDVRGIAYGAQTKLISVFQFPGGGAHLLLLLGAPFTFLSSKPKPKADPVRFLCAWLAFWAVAYLILWAKFNIPWQRYSIPLSTCLVVLGAVGWSRGSNLIGEIALARRLTVLSMLAGVASLASPAYFCSLMLYRFVNDGTHPLYGLCLALRDEPKRQIFLSHSWEWNSALVDIFPPDRFAVRFVPSLEEACSLAREGDLVVNLVFNPLRGRCSGMELSPIFHASNLGPPGYPFPADHLLPSRGIATDTVDYHYLFQEVTLFRITLTNSAAEIR